jgi:tetratricopeptide (TPR) repeat protein
LLRALELDPNFADAHELLAFCYWEQSGWLISDAEGTRLMGEAATKALAINPDLVLAKLMHGSANDLSWLQEIQGMEQALLQEPGRTEIVEALGWNLQNVGYLQEALDVAEQYVDRDPLLPAANYWLANALYSLGRTDEALDAWERAAQLDQLFAKLFISLANLVDNRDDIAIAYYEAWLQDSEYPDSSWVRNFVTNARDPATGSAYLDRRIPEVAVLLEENESESPAYMSAWYLPLGYIDRFVEILFETSRDTSWGDAEAPIWVGTIFRRTGFTAHPKYLEIAEVNGFIELWEQRGAPDFCDKMDDDWVCE